jgi:hypothetical protein
MEISTENGNCVIDLTGACAMTTDERDIVREFDDRLLETIVSERARYIAARTSDSELARNARVIDDIINNLRGVPVPRRRRSATHPGIASFDTSYNEARREAKRARDREYQRLRRERLRATRLAVVDEDGGPSSQSNDIDTTRVPSLGESQLVSFIERPSRDDAGRAKIECSVCYVDHRTKPFSSLACGHVFCSDCAIKAVSFKPRCPLCRASAKKTDIRRIFF